MTTRDRVFALSRLTTRDEAGRHFTERYDNETLADLESAGLIEIHRPIHGPTGIPYGPTDSSVEVTAEGVALVEANPEFRDAVSNWMIKVGPGIITRTRTAIAGVPTMNLWKLARITPADPPWGKYEGFVIRAPDEMHARNLANLEDPGSENIWLDPGATTCEPIYHQGPPQVILVDFHAG